MRTDATRHRRLPAGSVVLSLALAMALAGACTAPPARELLTFGGDVMGTRFNVRAVAPLAGGAEVSEVEREVGATLAAVDDAMTTYRDSEVTRFNAWRSTDPFAVSPATAEVVRLALRLAEETDGALDPTIAPLVDALGFGPSGPAALPDAATLEALRQRVGHERLSVDERGGLRKTDVDLQIDLSAIAKGYGVDRAAAVLGHLGIEDFMVEVGGEVRARGVNERGEPWRIAVERPASGRRQAQRVVSLRDLAMATSGDYRNYREVDGVRVSHLIDPRSGRSIEHRVASATVLHPECAAADGLATAMMILGEEGLELAEARGWAVLLLVRRNGEFVERQSSAFGELVESDRSADA